jgi:outer membrane protein assembly factor BamB
VYARWRGLVAALFLGPSILAAATTCAVADQPLGAVADDAPKAKRAGPPKVAPVAMGELEFAAIPWGKARGLGQNGGYVAAIDRATGKELWTLKVYDVRYDPALEGDVQDVFIKSLAKSASGRELIVTDERGRSYLVDPQTRSVRPQ